MLHAIMTPIVTVVMANFEPKYGQKFYDKLFTRSLAFCEDTLGSLICSTRH